MKKDNKNKEENNNSGTFYEFRNFERGIVETPKFNEYWNKQYEWLFCGKNNLYYNELLRLFLDASPLHSGLIRTKANMTAGQGFNKEGISPSALNFLKNPFGEESLDKIAFKCSTDLAIYGNFNLNIIWSKDKEKIASIIYVPSEKIRIAKPKEEFITNYYISRDWELARREENSPRKVAAFNILEKDIASQILQTKQYSPGSDYYSIPGYTSALNWIKLAYEINIFHLKGIQNGMHAGIIVMNPNGIPPQEMRDLEYQKLNQRFVGAEKNNDLLMFYAENKDKLPEIIPFPTNNSDLRFKTLIEQVNENIMLGHGANTIVAGIPTPGKLGSAAEVEEAYNSFNQKEIVPMQKIIEDTFQRLANINGVNDRLELIDFKPFSDSIKKLENPNSFQVEYIKK